VPWRRSALAVAVAALTALLAGAQHPPVASAAPCPVPGYGLFQGDLTIAGDPGCSLNDEAFAVYCSTGTIHFDYTVNGTLQGTTNTGYACGAPNRLSVFGNAGNDVIDLSRIAAADGFTAINLPNRLIGGVGDDALIGSSFADSPSGEAGADAVLGGEGDDSADGGDGDDVLDGGPGEDALVGGADEDEISGAGGRDGIDGGDGDDNLFGQAGRDRLLGATGEDRLRGGRGRDILRGGPGLDVLIGGPGLDRLRGGPGRDFQRQ